SVQNINDCDQIFGNQAETIIKKGTERNNVGVQPEIEVSKGSEEYKDEKDNQIALQITQIYVVVLIFIKFNFFPFLFYVRTLFMLMLLILFARITRMTNFKILEREPRFSLIFI
ncbi:hypothetical protein PanWU01x14_279930, partial [Parasponia andersonii]